MYECENTGRERERLIEEEKICFAEFAEEAAKGDYSIESVPTNKITKEEISQYMMALNIEIVYRKEEIAQLQLEMTKAERMKKEVNSYTKHVKKNKEMDADEAYEDYRDRKNHV